MSEGRFAPGAILAGRYRVIDLLGRGGMGEVYRADDLTLGQPVAMKFLPQAYGPGALERFHSEVRIARRVSHQNVCRVYDVGEVEGQTFLSMEYVDGEDLGSLLRRIGRLPPDKGIEIARKLCAGLAAAHDQGVLHRDLKPGNIMIDGRGQVIITDFGLAAFAGEVEGQEVRNGTPAYMAPEQLSGKEVTVRSDIYSLGLVLYEVFTGKRPFEANSIAELVRLRGDSTPTSMSAVVPDLDPAVERVIDRCLSADPQSRPASALAVAAALPGGDPLAAALAAGETPAPHLVASAGEAGALAPRTALLCLAAVIAGLAAFIAIGVRASGLTRTPLPDSPEILAHKARQIANGLGYTASPVDRASGLTYRNDFMDWVDQNDKPRADWNRVLAGRPSPLEFWYRESPSPMIAIEFVDDLLTPGNVRPGDPPLEAPGMILMRLDMHGRLTYLESIPPQREESGGSYAAPDWNPLFAAAGLDSNLFKPAEPQWTSLGASDARAAWTGVWPESERPLRIEAAAWRGKPVFFSLTGPWSRPDRAAGPSSSNISLLIIAVTTIAGAAFLAWRNYVRGRGDRRGATRLAAAVFLLHMLMWPLRAHVPVAEESFSLLVRAISTSLLWAAILWLLYMALEPFVRRSWPHSIISWSRVLSGRIRDPLVGRDVLYGVILGLVWTLLFEARFLVGVERGEMPVFGGLEYLNGARAAIGALVAQIPASIRGTFFFFFALFVFKLVLRKLWLAALAFTVLWAGMQLNFSDLISVNTLTILAVYGIAAIMVVRFGLITLIGGIFVANMLHIPVTTDTGAWYFASFALPFLFVVAVAGWGFHTALGGRALWKDEFGS